MHKKWVKFPNGKVWLLDEHDRTSGIVVLPEAFDGDLESFLDAISEEATGSICGLTDFAYQARGGDVVEFAGTIAQDAFDEGEIEPISPDSDEFKAQLQKQFGLSQIEVEHALSALENEFDEECVVKPTCSMRDLHTPAFPQPCSYVRVLVGGLEVAYWNADEIGEDPDGVMGAIVGALKGPA